MASKTNPIDTFLQRVNGLDISNENGLREFMNLARNHDKELFEDVLKRYSVDQQRMLLTFAEGRSLNELATDVPCRLPTSVGYQQSLDLLGAGANVTEPGAKPVDLMLHDPGSNTLVPCFEGLSFQNWGKTVENSPQLTCIPETVHGVQMVVKYAKAHNYGVRVAGYRHSWSSIFGRENADKRHPFILISTLPLDRAILQGPKKGNMSWDPELRNKEAEGAYAHIKTDLNEIKELQDHPGLVRVGCATTNEDFRRWCLQNRKWTLPLNVIMVEITFGGSNAPICHGAGHKLKTLSDLVEGIEYVDANGEIKTINKSANGNNMLAAASGCFGLLGVVTHLTLRLEKMSFAKMEPKKMPILEAIPPPDDMASDLPATLKEEYEKLKPKITTLVNDFEKRALEDYYAEWFWFPLHEQVWVNTWRLTTENDEIKKAQPYPSDTEIKKQAVSSFILEWSHEDSSKTRNIDAVKNTTELSNMAMGALPPTAADDGKDRLILTQLSDALHFRRGIQNFRVRDLEVEIPLPAKPDNASKPNLDIARRAWWQAIIEVYKPETMKTCPMRMPLEMRIMGGSDVIMAPQRGNKLGTCSIEVLTPLYMADDWEKFAQKIIDHWMALRNHDNLWKDLNIRPHWAKEWQQYKVDGKPWMDYLRSKSYTKEIIEFKEALGKIAHEHGWAEEDRRKLFSNELFDELLFGQ
ncbi:hypothetical protein MY11210_009456 [Beauveria gryllotalpidicola]